VQEGLEHRIVDQRARLPVVGRRGVHLGGEVVGIRPALQAEKGLHEPGLGVDD